ncbi:hypothetical protein BDV38DRAFT_275880 [Aspergillus pseudotamarii]|uniref:Uncharacterized protein n=1 Tax=Aspergillus pseudotamarii TaxID=132259 RepID=A0A5N6SAB3_ASPPS|nr:uncharacterized protein BDV38DRAFT_275880 [Aspergillus pseudotamarii]KAE8131515.1 hypothetical protein BDV38DRAFT_275880 [Aspergillus pseudotamarii]
MKFKQYDVCDLLGRQRTSFGKDKLQLLHTHDLFIRQTYFHTYNPSSKREHNVVSRRLQAIRQLSPYIWILVATSLTFSHIARLKDFDECIRRIADWKDIHPIPGHLEGRARAILEGLDEQRDRIIRGTTQD